VSIDIVQVTKPTMKITAFMRSLGAVVAASAAFVATSIGGGGGLSKLGRRRPGRDKSRRALAALDDDQLGNLRDIGRRIRREERQARSGS